MADPLPLQRRDPASALETQARTFQAELLRIERADMVDITSAYRKAAQGMAGAIKAAQDATRLVPDGVDPVTWLVEQRKVRALQAAAQRNMNDFAQYAAQKITERQRELAERAQRYAEELANTDRRSKRAQILAGQGQTTANLGGVEAVNVPSVLPAFQSIPVEAVSRLVGSLGDGTPLRQWADQFGKDAGRRIGETLIDGVTRGQGADSIGRALRQSLDGDAARSLTVARTETLRAYRGAKTEWMTANSTFIKGWQWYSRADAHTCPACWAMHGTFHEVEQVMGTHPNCRCLQTPVTKTLDEILGKSTGLVDQGLQVPDGAGLFAQQSPAFQRSVLGPTRYGAYAGGHAQLRDFVAVRHDKAWGTTRTAATATRAKDAAKARGHGAPAADSYTERIRLQKLKREMLAAQAAERNVGRGISIEGLVKPTPASMHLGEGARLIQTVHVPDIHVKFGGSRLQKRAAGSYQPATKVVKLRHFPDANKYGNTGASVAIHELGHAIDSQLFGHDGATRLRNGKLRWSGTDQIDPGDKLHGWKLAVNESGYTARMETEHPGTDFESRRYRRYVQGDDEMFARSYEQWIATRTQDAALLNNIAQTRMQEYWPEDDFKPIAAAFDKLFGVTP